MDPKGSAFIHGCLEKTAIYAILVHALLTVATTTFIRLSTNTNQSEFTDTVIQSLLQLDVDFQEHTTFHGGSQGLELKT